jgi:hypothetical protein
VTRRQEADHYGYRAPILQGVWTRITTFGAIRFWSHAWAAGCLFVGLLLLTYWGWRWLVVPVLAWLLGHGILVALTTWNPRFDEMAMAQLNRRYKGRYDAG